MYNFSFNSIIVIQSLPEDERQTGDEVAQTIRYACLKQNFPEIVLLWNLASKADMLGALLAIKVQAIADGVKPLIHFEIHGYEDGFQMANGEVVLWTDIKGFIRDINIATGNNLFLSLATCYGAFFLDTYSHCEPCPFFGYIGFIKEVWNRDLEYSFATFFETVILSGNVSEGIREMTKTVPAIQDTIAYINCHQYYKQLIEQNKETVENEEYKRAWINKIFVELKTRHPNADDNYILKIIHEMMNSGYYDRYFDECKKVFLHEAQGPVNLDTIFKSQIK